MFVYIRSAAFIIVVTQKLVFQQSKYVTAKCTEILVFNSPWSTLSRKDWEVLPPCRYIRQVYSIHCTVYSSTVPVHQAVPSDTMPCRYIRLYSTKCYYASTSGSVQYTVLPFRYTGSVQYSVLPCRYINQCTVSPCQYVRQCTLRSCW